MKKQKQKSIDYVDMETGDVIVHRFKNHFNAHMFIDNGERNVLPSLAVPDMALTVQEIIKRHTRGIPIFMHANGEFQNEPDPLNGRDINSLDIEEIHQIAAAARKRYNDAQEKWTLEQEQLRQQRVKEHWENEYKAKQEKLNRHSEAERAEPTRSAQSQAKD